MSPRRNGRGGGFPHESLQADPRAAARRVRGSAGCSPRTSR